ncbi:MAG: methyltransferase family protein [Promethearchaeota archaeon]
MFLLFLLNIILSVFFGILVILTKYDIRLDKLNKLLIFLLYLFSFTIPFWNQIRMWGAYDFYDSNHFFIYGVIYPICGFPTFIFGMINFFKIVHQNEEATNGKNATPQLLITSGFYAKMRHPMYAMIILFDLAWHITLGSIYGFLSALIVSLIFIYDARREEQKQLIPKFGEEYLTYCKEVPVRFFTRNLSILIIILLFLGITGTILEFI